jgi:hypothetical protein
MEDQRGNVDLRNPCCLCMVSVDRREKQESVNANSVHKLRKCPNVSTFLQMWCWPLHSVDSGFRGI